MVVIMGVSKKEECCQVDKDNIMHQDTVALDPETEELVILDQTRLPGQTVFLRLSTAEAI